MTCWPVPGLSSLASGLLVCIYWSTSANIDHIPDLAADIGLIRLDLAAQFRFKGLRTHRQTNAVIHEPRRLLCDAKIPCDLIAADSVLTVRNKPHGRKPLIKTNRRLFKDRAVLNRELLSRVFVAALPPTLIGQIENVVEPAGWAFNTIGPTDIEQMRSPHRDQRNT